MISDFPIKFSIYTSCRIHHIFWAWGACGVHWFRSVSTDFFNSLCLEKHFLSKNLFLWRLDRPFLSWCYVSYAVATCWEIFDSAMFQVNIFGRSMKKLPNYELLQCTCIPLLAGYYLTTVFVRVHGDISTEMTRPRQQTLGRNILNLSQAWRERIPWGSKRMMARDNRQLWIQMSTNTCTSDRNIAWFQTVKY